MEVKPVGEKELESYLDFRCSRCCYWMKGREFENDPGGWREWHQMMLERFGPPVLAAYDGGKPIGMVMFSPLDLASRPVDIQPFDIWNRVPEDEHGSSLYLYCIFVPDEGDTGKGVGRALMNSLVRILSNPGTYPSGGRLRRIYTVGSRGRPGPSAPASFFSRYGFEVIEELEETCLLMRLDLANAVFEVY